MKVIDASNLGNVCGGNDLVGHCGEIIFDTYKREEVTEKASGKIRDHFVIFGEKKGIIVYPAQYRVLVRTEKYFNKARGLVRVFEREIPKKLLKAEFFLIKDYKNH